MQALAGDASPRKLKDRPLDVQLDGSRTICCCVLLAILLLGSLCCVCSARSQNYPVFFKHPRQWVSARSQRSHSLSGYILLVPLRADARHMCQPHHRQQAGGRLGGCLRLSTIAHEPQTVHYGCTIQHPSHAHTHPQATFSCSTRQVWLSHPLNRQSTSHTRRRRLCV